MKNNQDNQIQSITLCNMYFSTKRYIQCTMGSVAKPPEGGDLSRIFMLHVMFYVLCYLTLCKITFNCKLQGKMGSRMHVLLGPPTILLGEQLPPLPPGSRVHEYSNYSAC